MKRYYYIRLLQNNSYITKLDNSTHTWYAESGKPAIALSLARAKELQELLAMNFVETVIEMYIGEFSVVNI